MSSKNTFKVLLCVCITNIFFLSAQAQQQVPVPEWVNGIGGMGDCKVAGIAVDQSDNVIVGGNFTGRIIVNVQGDQSPTTFTSQGDYDIFLFKYSPDGKLLSAKSFGGSGLDQLNNLDIDRQGNILIACQSNSTQMDCDPGPGVYNHTLMGAWDALVIKLNTTGDLEWVKTVGSTGTDYGHVVTADQQGNIIFVGAVGGSNVDVGQGWILNTKGLLDGFIIKYNSAGEVIWAYNIGSPWDEELKSVKTNSFGQITILGYVAMNADLNPKGPPQMLNVNTRTYYLAQYSPAGALIWHNTIAGLDNISATVTVDVADNIYVNGVYSGNVIFNSQSGGAQTLNSPNRALYLTKYNSKGALSWVRNVGGTSSNPYSYYLATDVNADIYIGGYFDRTLVFGTGTNSTTLTYHGDRDTFFAKYKPNGDFTWAFNFGSPCSDNFGHKIAVDSKSNVLLGGTFCRTVDFNPTTNCKLELTAVNFRGDGYIAKYNQTKINGEEPYITDLSLTEQLTPAVIDVNTKTVTITLKPGADITKLSPDITVEFGTIAPLSGISRDFTSPQKYIVTSSCNNYEWTVKVIRQSIPCPPQSTVAYAGDDQQLCNQSVIQIKGNDPDVNETGTWSVILPTNYDPFNASNRHEPTLSLNNFPSNEEIVFKWTITNSICPNTSSDQVKITNYVRPTLIFDPALYVKPRESKPLEIQIADAAPGMNYSWSPATGLDDPTVLNPIVTINKNQTYTLTVTYGNNCASVYTIDVSVMEELNIPNAFSPNMDGINDVWTIRSLNSYPNIEVMVFNRFGEQVFLSKGYPHPWNGTHKGKVLPAGIYFYIIKFKSEKTNLSGSITLIR